MTDLSQVSGSSPLHDIQCNRTKILAKQVNGDL